MSSCARPESLGEALPSKTLAVTLPQMGESVTEGVVGAWRKKVGDQVLAGETLVEIQTDKIDAEVPAPEAGVLVRIVAAEGDVVLVGAPWRKSRWVLVSLPLRTRVHQRRQTYR